MYSLIQLDEIVDCVSLFFIKEMIFSNLGILSELNRTVY